MGTNKKISNPREL